MKGLQIKGKSGNRFLCEFICSKIQFKETVGVRKFLKIVIIYDMLKFNEGASAGEALS